MNRLVVSDKSYTAVEFAGRLMTLNSDGRFTISLIGTQISPTSNEIVDLGHSPEDNREMFLLPLDTVGEKMKLADAQEKAKSLSTEFAVISGSHIYVPTIKELELIYKKKDSVGVDFQNATYLSSTINESGCPYYINFDNGYQGIHGTNVREDILFIMR